MRFFLRLVVIAQLGACSGGRQGLQLSIKPDGLVADGMSVAELAAAVEFRGEAIADGKRVLLTASQPVLFATLEDTVPKAAGGRVTGSSQLEVGTRGGAGRAYLQAPIVAGEVRIDASFTTVNKDVLSDTEVLAVGAAPFISGGSGDGDPSSLVEHFQFACAQDNVGAFVPSRPDIHVACTLILKDATGRDLPHTPLLLFAEAGDLVDTAATVDAPRLLVYVIPAQPITFPRDVRPSAAEQSHLLWASDNGPIAGAIEQNPRDGLVTLLVVARGQEGFQDQNGNGTYDEGEPFIDEGEPFLDVDDDGVYVDGKDPAPCCDTNGNGSVDGPNGRWDSDVWLGRMTHILWTGEVDSQRSYIAPAAAAIVAQSAEQFMLRGVDRQFNPVATADADDSLVVDVSLTTSRILLSPANLLSGVPLETTAGMLLNDRFPLFRFGFGDAVTNPVFLDVDVRDGLLYGREWTFSLTDNRNPGSASSQICQQLSWTVTATLTHTSALDYAGATFIARSTQVVGSGTLEAKPPPCP